MPVDKRILNYLGYDSESIQQAVDSSIPIRFVMKMKEVLKAHREFSDEMTVEICINLCWDIANEEHHSSK